MIFECDTIVSFFLLLSINITKQMSGLESNL
jgi:hypothetical protein